LQLLEDCVYERVYNAANREVWVYNFIASFTLIFVLITLIVGKL
jgi:hypothetical protein